jgi:glucose/arabinose dehydrogenase
MAVPGTSFPGAAKNRSSAVVNDHKVWERPVGVAVAHDGALLVSEDGDGTIWRIAYAGQKP